MKKHVIVSLIIIALAALTVAWAVYESWPPWKHIREQSVPCGPTNCHGFDVQCGQPAGCELVYQYGDNCRRFVKCSVINGTCQRTVEDRFEECKSCVAGCFPMLETDYLKAMECEYTCTL
ncbi:MAG: hypothetical protein QT00_C0002G0470 [archaeon GW2011_AR5]|nr:MAG: hypothetical protein QT00_C0002G0470 [archaeon GW2011_AR5]